VNKTYVKITYARQKTELEVQVFFSRSRRIRDTEYDVKSERFISYLLFCTPVGGRGAGGESKHNAFRRYEKTWPQSVHTR